MDKSETISELVKSLVKFNAEVTKIAKDAKNPFFKNNYATLDQIIEQVRPLLSANGMAVMQDVSTLEDGRVTVKTALLHESGEYIKSTGTTLKLAKNDPQGAGAGITYARRYDLSAVLSLNTGEDDDGNSAIGKVAQKQAAKQQKPAKKIVSTQIGDIKTKVMELAGLRNADPTDIYKTLKITELNELSFDYANSAIDQLDKWLISLAKKE